MGRKRGEHIQKNPRASGAGTGQTRLHELHGLPGAAGRWPLAVLADRYTEHLDHSGAAGGAVGGGLEHVSGGGAALAAELHACSNKDIWRAHIQCIPRIPSQNVRRQ